MCAGTDQINQCRRLKCRCRERARERNVCVPIFGRAPLCIWLHWAYLCGEDSLSLSLCTATALTQPGQAVFPFLFFADLHLGARSSKPLRDEKESTRHESVLDFSCHLVADHRIMIFERSLNRCRASQICQSGLRQSLNEERPRFFIAPK